jgi:hypothetical protein
LTKEGSSWNLKTNNKVKKNHLSQQLQEDDKTIIQGKFIVCVPEKEGIWPNENGETKTCKVFL